MAIEEPLSGWPGEELLWHGLYVKVLRRALISSLYCIIGGVCRLDRVGELNSEKNQLLRLVFLSFFATFKITPRMIKMLYLHILLADFTENWNAFCKLIFLDNYKISKKFKKSVLRYIENITGNFVNCICKKSVYKLIKDATCNIAFSETKKNAGKSL